jgi:serine/threonine protein kinase
MTHPHSTCGDEAEASGKSRYKTLQSLGRGSFGEVCICRLRLQCRLLRCANSVALPVAEEIATGVCAALRCITHAAEVQVAFTINLHRCALQVFLAEDTAIGGRVALKRIFIRRPHDGVPLNVLREYKCLQLVEHEHVMRLLDVFPSARLYCRPPCPTCRRNRAEHDSCPLTARERLTQLLEVLQNACTCPNVKEKAIECKRTPLQGQHIVMALELCHTDLYKVVRTAPWAMPPAVVKRWMRGLLEGVNAMHTAGALCS